MSYPSQNEIEWLRKALIKVDHPAQNEDEKELGRSYLLLSMQVIRKIAEE